MESVRKLENFHILLWLLKDISWLLELKILGLFMIVPTLSFACFITYKSRNIKLYFLPNLAVVFWICANSFWMFCEFVTPFDPFKIWAAVPFFTGLAIILLYILNPPKSQLQ